MREVLSFWVVGSRLFPLISIDLKHVSQEKQCFVFICAPVSICHLRMQADAFCFADDHPYHPISDVTHRITITTHFVSVDHT